MVSRGMLITVSRCRPGEMWTSMIVSVLSVWSSPVRRMYCSCAVSPFLLSEPYTRMFIELVLYTGGRWPSACPGTVTRVMLSYTARYFRYAVSVPAPTMMTAATATQRSTCRLPVRGRSRIPDLPLRLGAQSPAQRMLNASSSRNVTQ